MDATRAMAVAAAEDRPDAGTSGETRGCRGGARARAPSVAASERREGEEGFSAILRNPHPG